MPTAQPHNCHCHRARPTADIEFILLFMLQGPCTDSEAPEANWHRAGIVRGLFYTICWTETNDTDTSLGRDHGWVEFLCAHKGFQMTPARDLQTAHTPVETLQIAIVAYAMPVWYLCGHRSAPDQGPRSQYKQNNSEPYVSSLISKCMNSP